MRLVAAIVTVAVVTAACGSPGRPMSTYKVRVVEADRTIEKDVDRDGPCYSGQELPSNATVVSCRQTMVGERHGAGGWAIAIGVLVTLGLLVVVGLAGAGGRT